MPGELLFSVSMTRTKNGEGAILSNYEANYYPNTMHVIIVYFPIKISCLAETIFIASKNHPPPVLKGSINLLMFGQIIRAIRRK